MDWTKLNETIDPRWHEIDDPIPVYHSKEKLEPKQIYISTAGSYDTPYYQMYKEYMDRLAYQYSCTVPTYYIKLSEDFERGLRAKVPSLYNDVMTEDGLTLMTNGHVEELAKKITATSIVKNLDELEELIEQKYKENNDVTE